MVEDQALRTWVNQSIALTGMPTDPEYILKTKVQSTWPACIAFKAAQLQGEELGERFFRKLMEAIQIEARNGSDEEVYLQIAKEAGLDPSRLKRDISSDRVRELFEKDKDSMNVNFLTLILVNSKTTSKRSLEKHSPPSRTRKP